VVDFDAVHVRQQPDDTLAAHRQHRHHRARNMNHWEAPRQNIPSRRIARRFHGLSHLSMRGPWRADHDLVHPDGKTVAADHAHRDHGPNQDRENEEREQFLPPGIERRGTILSIGVV